MFRSAQQIEVEAAAKKLEGFRDDWRRGRDEWFDGTPRSVDQRIAKLDRVLSFASRTAQLTGTPAGNFCLAALPNLKANREELLELRRQLLGGWFGGGDDEASQFNCDPRMYPCRRDWMDASNLRSYIQDAQEKNGPEQVQRHRHEDMGFSPEDVTRLKGLQAAREFIEDQNTTDRQELLIRAQRLVEARTSHWTPQASRDGVRAFLEAVDAQIPRQARHASRAAGVESIEDFDAQLMFS